MYVSDDGGYTWIKALVGPHHYAILDSGGLIVAVEDRPNRPISEIKSVTVCVIYMYSDFNCNCCTFFQLYLAHANVCTFFDVISDFLPMKDSAGVFTTSPKTPSTLPGWRRSRELAP